MPKSKEAKVPAPGKTVYEVYDDAGNVLGTVEEPPVGHRFNVKEAEHQDPVPTEKPDIPGLTPTHEVTIDETAVSRDSTN